jgi:hypothetical protein
MPKHNQFNKLCMIYLTTSPIQCWMTQLLWRSMQLLFMKQLASTQKSTLHNVTYKTFACFMFLSNLPPPLDYFFPGQSTCNWSLLQLTSLVGNSLYGVVNWKRITNEAAVSKSRSYSGVHLYGLKKSTETPIRVVGFEPRVSRVRNRNATHFL